jgi:monoamine oxidase
VLIGYYQSGTPAIATGKMTAAEREKLALDQGRLIHPQYKDHFEKSFSVAWQNVQYNKGAWAQMQPAMRQALSPKLLEPDRRMYFAGDHCSNLTAWMAGALESGRYVARSVHVRAQQEAKAAA